MIISLGVNVIMEKSALLFVVRRRTAEKDAAGYEPGRNRTSHSRPLFWTKTFSIRKAICSTEGLDSVLWSATPPCRVARSAWLLRSVHLV